MPDDADSCQFVVNSDQTDLDGDDLGDACDDDLEGDGSDNADDCKPDDPLAFPGNDKVCDELDNNCDDTADDFCTSWETQCGIGTTHCAAGIWSDCTAVTLKSCLDYETCETSDSCNATWPQTQSEICNGVDDCNNATDEDFTCMPDQVDTASCGTCGLKTRVWDATCDWLDWPGCFNEGECQPEAEGSEVCGQCGSKSRTCSDACTWNDFGACTDQGDCSPGDADNKACGVCGVETRTCNDNCAWSGWWVCSGEGTCHPTQLLSEAPVMVAVNGPTGGAASARVPALSAKPTRNPVAIAARKPRSAMIVEGGTPGRHAGLRVSALRAKSNTTAAAVNAVSSNRCVTRAVSGQTRAASTKASVPMARYRAKVATIAVPNLAPVMEAISGVASPHEQARASARPVKPPRGVVRANV